VVRQSGVKKGSEGDEECKKHSKGEDFALWWLWPPHFYKHTVLRRRYWGRRI